MTEILDMCCGSRMFYFDKKNENVIFGDIRAENHILCDGRKLKINPDVLFNFRALPFCDNKFNMVIFDPPHLIRGGENSWMVKKYGILKETWKNDISAGFKEAFRVLKTGGTLIFKWNETQIPVSHILKLTDEKPIIGHRSGKASKTHWVTFLKN